MCALLLFTLLAAAAVVADAAGGLSVSTSGSAQADASVTVKAIERRVTQERPLSNARLVMPLALSGSALDADDESSEEAAPPSADGRALLAALLALQRPTPAGAEPLRRLCGRPRAQLTPAAARLCQRLAPAAAPPDASSEERTCPGGGCAAQNDASPCSLLGALLQGGAQGDGAGPACPLCALLHAAAHVGAAHAAHECPLCSALAKPAAAAPASPRAPRALVVWLNPNTRRDWNVLREEVPGEVLRTMQKALAQRELRSQKMELELLKDEASSDDIIQGIKVQR